MLFSLSTELKVIVEDRPHKNKKQAKPDQASEVGVGGQRSIHLIPSYISNI